MGPNSSWRVTRPRSWPTWHPQQRPRWRLRSRCTRARSSTRLASWFSWRTFAETRSRRARGSKPAWSLPTATRTYLAWWRTRASQTGAPSGLRVTPTAARSRTIKYRSECGWRNICPAPSKGRALPWRHAHTARETRPTLLEIGSRSGLRASAGAIVTADIRLASFQFPRPPKIIRTWSSTMSYLVLKSNPCTTQSFRAF